MFSYSGYKLSIKTGGMRHVYRNLVSRVRLSYFLSFFFFLLLLLLLFFFFLNNERWKSFN